MSFVVLQSVPTWLPEIVRSGTGLTIMMLALAALAAILVYAVGSRVVIRFVHAVLRRTRFEWDDLLVEFKVIRRAFAVVPLLVFRAGLELVPGLSPGFEVFLERLIAACLVLVVARTVAAFLSVLHGLYDRMPRKGTPRPIKGYVQLAKVVVYVIAGIFIVARLADQSPWYFVSGLGAMMAVITLVFRDTLLSLVAGVQLTNNDLIRVGDWIEMPQFQADGDVIDIALNTVRVQNWDKTFTVIPTHKFLENSFKNWRGMQETGGRRIKRSIFVNTSTVRFLTDEEIEHLSHFVLLRDYIADKQKELEIYNATYKDEPDLIVNARRLTNVGTFRAYVMNYLRNHAGINQKLTLLVRQLQPTPEGLPIQIYAFTSDVRWAAYEGVQSDVFDHLLSIAPEFGLRIYQRPSGHDLEAMRADAAL